MTRLIAVFDQGTTSTRCVLFDRATRVVAFAQREHRQIYPQPGWVEHDPIEIWHCVQELWVEVLSRARVTGHEIAAIGVTNQRETVVVWERANGRPIAPAIVWQDTRTSELCRGWARDGGIDRLRPKTGLPLATYFSGPKLSWLLSHVSGARADAGRGRLMAGTIDSWLIWNLTGGPDGGRHVTDVSNASRTQLMNIHTMEWDDELLDLHEVLRELLPEIRSSSECYGDAVAIAPGVPVAGNLGDQQAALFGQTCFAPGDAKNTYGTGCFLLMNTGREPIFSQRGLLTTVAWRIGGDATVYALEGSVAVAGALVQWLRDRLGMIDRAGDSRISSMSFL